VLPIFSFIEELHVPVHQGGDELVPCGFLLQFKCRSSKYEFQEEEQKSDEFYGTSYH
jgi:hypothetical protein